MGDRCPARPGLVSRALLLPVRPQLLLPEAAEGPRLAAAKMRLLLRMRYRSRIAGDSPAPEIPRRAARAGSSGIHAARRSAFPLSFLRFSF